VYVSGWAPTRLWSGTPAGGEPGGDSPAYISDHRVPVRRSVCVREEDKEGKQEDTFGGGRPEDHHAEQGWYSTAARLRHLCLQLRAFSLQ